MKLAKDRGAEVLADIRREASLAVDATFATAYENTAGKLIARWMKRSPLLLTPAFYEEFGRPAPNTQI